MSLDVEGTAARGDAARPLTTGDRAFLSFTRRHPGEYLEAGVVLGLDDPTLTLAELRADVAARLRGAPALMERLSRPTAPPGDDDTVWAPSRPLIPEYHVSAEDLPAGSGDAGLREALDRIAARPLKLDRPLWRLWLLRGHRPDGVAVAYRFSHIHQDGGALRQALHLLFGPLDRPPGRSLPAFAAPHAADYARAAAGALRGIRRTRQLSSWGGPPVGGARHSWALAELDVLRRIGRRHGGSVNDVYLTALAGALRAWSAPEWDAGSRPVHAAMPMSLRGAGEEDMLSNFTFGARIRLPCAEPDPRRRLADVAAETRRARAGGSTAVVQRRILEATPPDASPRVLAQAASAGARPRDVALVASNAGLMPGPLTVAGRPVTSLIGMPPLFVGRQHLSVALFGLGGQVCAAFTASASVPRHTELPGLWRAELDVLDALAPVPARRDRSA